MNREEELKKYYNSFSSGQSPFVKDLIDKYNLTPEELLKMRKKYCRHEFRYNDSKGVYYCIKCLTEVKK